MLLHYLALTYGTALVVGSPVPDLEPQLSEPLLIPTILGITDPMISNAPALPILQVPGPPLPSIPFTGSNTKPKKIGYFWTGAGDNQYADFLATYSLDDDTFGQFIWLTDVPTSGNSPHHLGVSADGKTLVGGGLLSLLKTQDTAYYFDVSNPYRPKFSHSNRALLSSMTDEIHAKPDGGFIITYMGSAAGASPGRLVETDSEYNIIGEFPAVTDIAGTLNTVEEPFNPHGLTVDWNKNIILTSDYVVPVTILKPSLGIVLDNTLRLWKLDTRTVISTITIPNGGGIQDVKFIPGNPESAAVATAVALGQVWIIYPFRYDRSGKQGVAELLYDLGPKAENDGKYAYFTLTTDNHIAALDISDLNNVKRLDDPSTIQPTIGPHYIKVTPDQKHIIVNDYFLQTGDNGLVNTPADYRALYIDINPDGSLHFNRSIDFVQQFSRGGINDRGGAKPHSTVVFDLTDPAHPYYS
ncbi:uncharacterized protein K444DRAFT_525706 [Hyaloscypha bicolor E]|uniref:Uncharacterized protein n=1 Tax=Hyaloscypha bicolor E TaxID=1095630 RepID=A0A2J6TGI7_9HELO|nr:uncharacterized protein K444DRAFT_525706 [Hyaloscypha bicolor E]PMD62146.1 hypothetical protein K444DRAFT_525706 [Hyaloscypha bicolor E]